MFWFGGLVFVLLGVGLKGERRVGVGRFRGLEVDWFLVRFFWVCM